jgi:hypothetical protein
MKENINEHDMTKKMMDILRGGYKTRLLIEADEQGQEISPEGEEQKDTLSPKAGDSVFNDELKKLQDTVDPRVEITNFKIYPTDGNVIIEGIFLKRENDDTGIKFKMSLASGEIETSMSNIDLSDKVSMLLQKLKGYYENWVDEWALKLANEYKPKES